MRYPLGRGARISFLNRDRARPPWLSVSSDARNRRPRPRFLLIALDKRASAACAVGDCSISQCGNRARINGCGDCELSRSAAHAAQWDTSYAAACANLSRRANLRLSSSTGASTSVLLQEESSISVYPPSSNRVPRNDAGAPAPLRR
jgi:hypothetical protein